MTKAEIYQMVASIGLPAAYTSFGEGQSYNPPYLVYSYSESNHFYADGMVYQDIERMSLNLYTAKKDPDSEFAVESVLQSHGLSWRKKETYYSSERIYEVNYEMEVMINGEE